MSANPVIAPNPIPWKTPNRAVVIGSPATGIRPVKYRTDASSESMYAARSHTSTKRCASASSSAVSRSSVASILEGGEGGVCGGAEAGQESGLQDGNLLVLDL